jgi:glycosyltransferase involved in cell wall biosynthesis
MTTSLETHPLGREIPNLDRGAVSGEHLEAAINRAASADECVALATEADGLQLGDLHRRALERAVALDRNCQSALLALAALAMDDGTPSLTFAFLEEAARAGLLPDEVLPLHRELLEHAKGDARLENYLRAIGRIPKERLKLQLSIVVVTNLFPPQELGGYGRMMWEFARGLAARGHTVQVLTSDEAAFGQPPTDDETTMEKYVSRTLKLTGTWKGGKPVPIAERPEILSRLRENAARLRSMVTRLDADLVVAGNLDFLGISLLRPALDKKVPVLHALANANPGYAVSEQPREAHYWVAPCSDWNGKVFQQAGYAPKRVETLYPGARIDRFFRLFLPDTKQLRICYASLMLPYKGANTLIGALARLQAAGIEFTAEIAGDSPDGAFLQEMRTFVRERGMEERVRFIGFLDRDGLGALFARSNVLVFPSRFEEPFGISQVEALAAGLVVVSSGTGGAKEIVRDGIDGLLFRAGDDADLALKLAGLARQPEFMARLQRQGQSRSTAFSVDAAVEKIETLAGAMRQG